MSDLRSQDSFFTLKEAKCTGWAKHFQVVVDGSVYIYTASVMARGMKKQRGDGTRSRGRSQRPDDGINAAYQDMLAEVNSSPTQTGDEGRAIKRRRVRGRIVAQDGVVSLPGKCQKSAEAILDASHEVSSHPDQVVEPSNPTHPLQQEQLAYTDDSSGESDLAWEEVDLPNNAGKEIEVQPDEEEEQMLELVLDGDGERHSNMPAPARRKPLTTLEKQLRRQVHQVHLLCLLSHVHLRNHWCNDQDIHVCYQPFAVHGRRLNDNIESPVPPFAQANCLSSQPQ